MIETLSQYSPINDRRETLNDVTHAFYDQATYKDVFESTLTDIDTLSTQATSAPETTNPEQWFIPITAQSALTVLRTHKEKSQQLQHKQQRHHQERG